MSQSCSRASTTSIELAAIAQDIRRACSKLDNVTAPHIVQATQTWMARLKAKRQETLDTYRQHYAECAWCQTNRDENGRVLRQDERTSS